jgi:hypothetical protein
MSPTGLPYWVTGVNFRNIEGTDGVDMKANASFAKKIAGGRPIPTQPAIGI